MKMADDARMVIHRNRALPTDLFLRLNKLRHESLLCDLSIVVEGEKFKAHKVVMAACSDYFLSAICGSRSPGSNPDQDESDKNQITIELQYVTIRGFAPLLDYAYTSELNVNESDVIDVLSAASCLQMFDVANACSRFIRTSLHTNQTRLAGLQVLAGRSGIYNGHCNDYNKLSTSGNNGRSHLLPGAGAVNTLFQAAKSGVPPDSTVVNQASELLPINQLKSYNPAVPTWSNNQGSLTNQNSVVDLVREEECGKFLTKSASVSPVCIAHSSSASSEDSKKKRYSVPNEVLTNEIANEIGFNQQNKLKVTKMDVAKAASADNIKELQSRELQLISSSLNASKNSNNPEECKSESKAESNQRENKLQQNNTATSQNNSNSNIEELTANGPKRKESLPSQQEPPPSVIADSWPNWQKLYSNFSQSDAGTFWNPANFFTPNNAVKNAEVIRKALNPVMSTFTSSAATNPSIIGQHQSRMLSPMNNHLAFLSNLNGFSLQRQLLQHQLMVQQHAQQMQASSSKIQQPDKLLSDLPAVPPNGQYTSVRRRTLQSNVPKPHQCQICGSRFTRYHNLKQHIKLHSGVKPYECDVCGKRFTRNYTLRLHKMKHIGLRNFKCGTCSAAFTSLGEFRAHLRLTMHTNIQGNNSERLLSQEQAPSHQKNLYSSSSSVLDNQAKFKRFDNLSLQYGFGSPPNSGDVAYGEGSVGNLSPTTNETAMVVTDAGSSASSVRSCSSSPENLSGNQAPVTNSESQSIGSQHSLFKEETNRIDLPISKEDIKVNNTKTTVSPMEPVEDRFVIKTERKSFERTSAETYTMEMAKCH